MNSLEFLDNVWEFDTQIPWTYVPKFIFDVVNLKPAFEWKNLKFSEMMFKPKTLIFDYKILDIVSNSVVGGAESEDVRTLVPARQHADAGRGGVLSICVGLLPVRQSMCLSVCLVSVAVLLSGTVYLSVRISLNVYAHTNVCVCSRTSSHSLRLFLTSDSFRVRRATDSDCWRSAAFTSVLLCPCLCVCVA